MFTKKLFGFAGQAQHEPDTEVADTSLARHWADTVPASDMLRDQQLREARHHQAYLPTAPANLSTH